MSRIQIGFPSGLSERIGLSIMGLMGSQCISAGFQAKTGQPFIRDDERISALSRWLKISMIPSNSL